MPLIDMPLSELRTYKGISPCPKDIDEFWDKSIAEMEALGTGKYKLNYKVTLTWDDYIYNLREYCRKRTMWLSDHLAPGQTVTTYHGGTVSTK